MSFSSSIRDPLLKGFSRLNIDPKPGQSKTSLLMDLGKIIIDQKVHGRQFSSFDKTGDSTLESIVKHLNRSGYRLAWEKIIFLGCSAGGNVALRSLFKQVIVPHIPIVIVMHHHPGFAFLTKMETKDGILVNIEKAEDGQSIRGSRVYFLPGDKDISYSAGTTSFSMRPVLGKQKFRPDINRAFTNLAQRFGNKAMAVILSGMLYDGAEGVKAVHMKQGEVWVQDPKTALFKDMPENAIKALPIPKIADISKIGNRINELTENYLTIKPSIGRR